MSKQAGSAPAPSRFFSRTRFRLRAAAYGWQIRTAQPTFELFRVVLLIPGVLLAVAAVGVAVCGAFGSTPAEGASAVRDSLPATLAVLGFAFVLVPVATLLYLGNLATIMDVAAWSEEGAHRLRRDMEIGMGNDTAYEQLISLYEPVVVDINKHLAEIGEIRRFEWVEMDDVEREQERYAAIAMPARDEDLTNLLGPIKGRDYRRLRMLADSRQRLMRTWRQMNEPDKKREDELGDNYCLRDLSFDKDSGAMRLDVAVASYGEIMRSSDAMINEFALFAYLCGPIGRRRRPSVRERRVLEMSPQAMLRCLPWRRRVHREHRGHERDLFLAPGERAAGLGIAVVTLERGERGTDAYLGIRSGKVGTYPATNHVIPAGMCNTYGTNYEVGFGQPPPSDYLTTVMRCEFLEEWAPGRESKEADEEEFESNKRRGWAKRVNAAWDDRVDDGVIEPLKLTGVAFDLLNLRPEICAAISVGAQASTLNWEFDQIGVHSPLAKMGRVRRTEIVQGGAAALRLAQLADGKNGTLSATRGVEGWIPEAEYRQIERRVPILCVDLLPLRPDASAVGLIRRKTYEGGEGWCLIGGAVMRDESLLAALRRHVETTLGAGFVADLSAACPLTTVEYFSEPGLGEFYDPRKHAVALTYAAPCTGTAEPQGEALEFSWIPIDELPLVEFGFGQGPVVERVLARWPATPSPQMDG
ncbi:MAG TPA: DUF4916 domain-containing protein [Solirubrobacterales bacterium]|nr:DUF4916 domain-containing protein [Solirubrobacterales bacterium]